MDKAPEAFRTISEVADELDIPQHVLRFWETRFSQIKPMKRSGGRRFYRPDDVDLLRGIRRLLYGEGYTIRGVQRILKEQGIKSVQSLSDMAKAVPSLYALDDGVKLRPPERHDENGDDDSPHDDSLHVAQVNDERDGTHPSKPAVPPPRRPMATPLLPRMDAAPRFDVAPPFDPTPRPGPAPTAGTRSVERASQSAPPSSTAAARVQDRRPMDINRLKAVIGDLVACRQILDRALVDLPES